MVYNTTNAAAVGPNGDNAESGDNSQTGLSRKAIRRRAFRCSLLAFKNTESQSTNQFSAPVSAGASKSSSYDDDWTKFSLAAACAADENVDAYFWHVAKHGQSLFHWSLVRAPFLWKLDTVMRAMIEKYPPCAPPSRNVDETARSAANPPAMVGIVPVDTIGLAKVGATIEERTEMLRQQIMDIANSHDGIPFTFQRICELLCQPLRHYKSADKLLRALEKTINVVTYVRPNGARVTGPTPLADGRSYALDEQLQRDLEDEDDAVADPNERWTDDEQEAEDDALRKASTVTLLAPSFSPEPPSASELADLDRELEMQEESANETAEEKLLSSDGAVKTDPENASSPLNQSQSQEFACEDRNDTKKNASPDSRRRSNGSPSEERPTSPTPIDDERHNRIPLRQPSVDEPDEVVTGGESSDPCGDTAEQVAPPNDPAPDAVNNSGSMETEINLSEVKDEAATVKDESSAPPDPNTGDVDQPPPAKIPKTDD